MNDMTIGRGSEGSADAPFNLPLEGRSRSRERSEADLGRGKPQPVKNPPPESRSRLRRSRLSTSPQGGGWGRGAPEGKTEAPAWEERRGRTLRSPAELVAAGLVAAERLPELEAVAARYAVAVTPAMDGLIDAADPHDPIARQFVPDPRELDVLPEERADPIGDDVHQVSEGLIHRYPDRVLLKLVSVCAVYCRFCFRRETIGPGRATMLGDDALEGALRYIGAHKEIWEVIVSGGDPLIASPRRIAALMQGLAAIDHVKIVRFHTRVPVVAPEKVTGELVAALQIPGKTTWVAIHANHPRELTADARAAIARLADAGIPLVGQTVLLAGVNDDAETLSALMRGFVEARVKPYYLHHGDLAPGTGHFRTSIEKGHAVMRAMRGDVSGLCQPTYMLDIPGGAGKVPVGPGYARRDGEGWLVEDPWGGVHRETATL